MQTYEGRLDATGLRIVVVASWFNADDHEVSLRRRPLGPAPPGPRPRQHPRGRGGAPGITVAWVPSAFELPPTAKRQPFWPAYLTAERIAKATRLKLAITAGIGSDHVDLQAAMNAGMTVAEVAGDVWFPQPAPQDHPWRTMPHHGMTPTSPATRSPPRLATPPAPGRSSRASSRDARSARSI